MLSPGNRSKPRYGSLEPDLSGKYHLLFGEGNGAEALLRLVETIPQDARVQIIYAEESFREKNFSDALRAIGHCDTFVVPTRTEAIASLDDVLSKSQMGTRLYIAGPESFIGAAVRITLKYNMNTDEVQCEHCGSAARSVYCVHCKTSHENVTTNIVECAGCGRWLLVRDHYSRRLAAYMGVMADAESPGNLPPLRTVYE